MICDYWTRHEPRARAWAIKLLVQGWAFETFRDQRGYVVRQRFADAEPPRRWAEKRNDDAA